MVDAHLQLGCVGTIGLQEMSREISIVEVAWDSSGDVSDATIYGYVVSLPKGVWAQDYIGYGATA